ncbi:hypothetical protein [Delftia sp. HK171]|uniref:hypothetical protein n=1 Tax=Delftia sp. HK171 TaxID=1920191 RepID=UPI00114EBED7|nr:hypothetical protein [Delftia sp. HK171]
MAIDEHAHRAHRHEFQRKEVEAVTLPPYFTGRGVHVKRLLADNGATLHSRAFAAIGNALDVQYRVAKL